MTRVRPRRFPADEMLRYYNRTLALHPHAKLALMFLDYGHPRSQNNLLAEAAYDQRRLFDWFDYYVKGDHEARPLRGVEALTPVCGGHYGGPFYASNWVAIHSGRGALPLGACADDPLQCREHGHLDRDRPDRRRRRHRQERLRHDSLG